MTWPRRSKLVTQGCRLGDDAVLRNRRVFLFGLQCAGECRCECLELLGQFTDARQTVGIGRPAFCLLDRCLEAGLRRLCCLGVGVIAGDNVVADRLAERDQFTVDIAGEIGFRDAGARSGHARRDTSESDIGETHADR